MRARVGVAVDLSAIEGRVPVSVGVGVSVAVGIGVSVGKDVHQGAVNENPSKSQVRLAPPLQIVSNIFNCKPAWKSVPWPRSAGGGENRLAAPMGIETEKLFGL